MGTSCVGEMPKEPTYMSLPTGCERSKNAGFYHNLEKPRTGESLPGAVQIQILPPHFPQKQRLDLELPLHDKRRSTWRNVCKELLYPFTFALAVLVYLLVLHGSVWSYRGEPQAPMLSLPLNTNWRLLITLEKSCAEDPPFVALVVMTGAADSEGRKIIRDTWGGATRVAGRRVRLFFIAGATASPSVGMALEEEAKQYGDILQHSAPDKYSNLSTKTATIIQWLATSCPQAKFLVKADTDTLVNLDILVPYLKEMEGTKDLALGVRLDNMPLVTSPGARNYQDPLVYPHKTFPPYLSGACYAISGDLVEKMSHVLAEVPRVRNEDTFVGMCLKRLGVQPRNIGPQAPIDPWFGPAKGPCAAFRLAAAHPLKRDLMVAMWQWWQTGGSKMCL